MKFLIVFILAVLMIQTGQALEVQKIQVDLQDLSFINNQGDGQARDAYVEIGQRSQAIRKSGQHTPVAQTVYINRAGKDMEIQAGPATVLWKNMPEWMTIDLDLKANDVMLKLGYTPSNIITARSITLIKPSLGRATISNLKLVCTPLAGHNAEFENLIDQCLKEGNITATALDIPSLKNFWKEILDDERDNTEDLQKIGEDLTVSLKNNNFVMGLKTKVFLKARIKAAGSIILDNKTNIARIQLTEVRFGKLNITKLVLPVLGSVLSMKGIEVRPPYIYVQM
jgi:hypothetical protein